MHPSLIQSGRFFSPEKTSSRMTLNWQPLLKGISLAAATRNIKWLKRYLNGVLTIYVITTVTV
jgi:hypothetical protein